MKMLSRAIKTALGLALLLAPLAGWGQPQGWHYNAGGRLLGVKSRGNNIWIVGAQGLILHSTDGGNTWNIRESGTQNTLRGVSFPDDLHGWIVGDNDYDTATVLRTTDGGINWQIQTSLRTRWGYGISYVDSLHGWICGPIDTVYKTTNGGTTWTKLPQGQPNHGTSVVFIDTLRGWLSLDTGAAGILKTTDGGQTWRFILGSGGQFQSLDMLDSMRGWGAGGNISKTTDGWETWTVQYSPPGYLFGISLGDSLYIWSVGGNSNVDRAMIVSTTNGGFLWTMDTSRTRNNIFYSVDGHLQLNNVTVVGNGGAILRSTNAGSTWRVIRNTDIKDRSLYNTAFYDSDHGWAVGTYGVITHTTNGGNVWMRQVSGTFEFLWGVSAPDSLKSWACGDSGIIMGTTDAGNNWLIEPSGTTFPLTSIDLVDDLYGVAVGGGYGPKEQKLEVRSQKSENDTLRPWRTNPTPYPSPAGEGRYDFWKWPWRPEETKAQTPYRAITRTTNGGALWIAQNISGEVPLNGVSFINRAEGWACGVPQGGIGVIIHTTDSGATWTGQSSNVNQTLNWIQFKDRLNGWCVGTNGTALWTTDGGTTWNQGNTGTTSVLWSCGFYDNLHGFACGNNGLLVKTVDGGRNWTPDTSKVYANLTAVNALDSTHAWAVGSYGMVLGWRLAGMPGVETRGQGDKGTKANNSIKAWPNPFVSYARVPGHEKERFALYDITGRRMGTYTGEKIGADVASGIYFLMAVDKEAGPRTEGRPVRIVKVR